MWQEVSIDKCGFGYSNREEALKSNKKWFPYNKGGDFRKWYGNNEYMVNWENDGFEICHFTDAKGKLRSRPQNTQFYFKQSLTWSFVSSTSFGVRYSPEGALFDIGGSSVFPQREDAFYLLGLLCSNISFEYMKLQNPTMNFQVGNVANIPVIISRKDRPRIECLVRENISFSKSDWDSYETSWDFLHRPLACRGSVSESKPNRRSVYPVTIKIFLKHVASFNIRSHCKTIFSKFGEVFSETQTLIELILISKVHESDVELARSINAAGTATTDCGSTSEVIPSRHASRTWRKR